ncbi:MAG: presqualene diphosphate synthase HpnD [Rhodospirillales bacterium]|nr:presqualene diphosphate synthase HpnD [Rhodospirillales bacterium]
MNAKAQTSLDARRSDLDEVEALVRAAGTSFYRGMAVLPLPRRQAMYAIYAFCRIVDDIADDEVQFTEKAPRLDAWRARIAALYAEGRADEAVTRVLRPAIAAYALREEDFLAIVDGMAMDAAAPIVAPDLATLDLYCDRVAAAVGRLSVRAFGDASAAADEVAYHLGRALQMTNILRDVGEDAARGRLYLPREDLEAEGVPPSLPDALASPGLARAAGRLAARAEAHFAAAEKAMRRCEQAAMRPARLMGATYAAILRRVRARGWRDLRRRVGLPLWEKLYIALRFGLT